ncbi:hypothetical protein NPIL_361971, partial [Nephila pilipes]
IGNVWSADSEEEFLAEVEAAMGKR